jgi:hypothetical protein
VQRKIFISYRRSDTAAVAGRIYDRLIRIEPKENVFFDVSAITPGGDFDREIAIAMEVSEVAVFLIGDKWLTGEATTGPSRIWEDGDHVRAELRAALAQKQMKILPVLIGHTRMPTRDELPPDIQGITARNAMFLRHETFETDAEIIISAIVGPRRPAMRALVAPVKALLGGFLGSIAGFVLLTVIGIAHRYLAGSTLSGTIGPTATSALMLLLPILGFGSGVYYMVGRRRNTYAGE